uniref:NADH-ubiquinone oxidoreductase chain 5 n=1 Tax=Helicella itala TaxID=76043 RepID=A0A1S5R328_9EUPU|nr:NADH dehydrogenase subunit 5 [Helicella itala]
MVFKHMQRLSVLLFLSFSLYMVLYLTFYLPYKPSYLLSIDLFSISSSLVNMSLIFDSVSLGFSALVTFISACVFLFARNYMNLDPYYFRFVWILLSFVMSMNILILSGSFLTLMVGWDGLGVSSFALIIYYQSKESVVSGFLTLLINRLGDVVIMSLMFFMAMSGVMLLVNYSREYQYMMVLLLSVAGLTKSAQYPFSVWLPAAMAAPTPVSALVHSSTLVTAGVYIIIRVAISMQLPTEVMSMLLFCGAMTSLLGGLCAMVENDLKKIIALSTLSQLGVMMFSLGLGAHNLALLHLFAHAMFKALLFLVAGAILMLSFGVQDIRLLGAVTRMNPLLLVYMNVSAFCLMGLPFLSAFYSKHVILGLMWSSSANVTAVVMLLISSGLTGLYMVRLLKAMNWSNQVVPLASPILGWLFYLPMNLLLLGSVTSGLMFSCLDETLQTNLLTPPGNELIVNLSVLLGVLIGILIINRRSVPLLSSMFYLVPLWYHSPYVYSMLSVPMKHLDKGWLEPYCMSRVAHQSFLKVSSLYSWPTVNLGYLPYMLFLGGNVALAWVCLK